MSQPVKPGQRVAFFGGSFDPPHLGHLAVAHAALAALTLDTVLFAPVGAQPLKPAGAIVSFDDRVEMTRLAIEGERSFKLSLADAPKPGGKPNYTLETLQAIKNELPLNSKLYCLMGADSFGGFQQWFHAAEIPFVAPLIVASRPGKPLTDLTDLKALLPSGLSLQPACEAEPARPKVEESKIELQCYSLANSAGQHTPFYLLPELDIPISASKIRELFRDPENAAKPKVNGELLPAAVAEYIRARGLYR
jgi:nicotinate-nucleotide adenylyltransferase